ALRVPAVAPQTGRRVGGACARGRGPPRAAAARRHPEALMDVTLALDIGGTKIAAGLVDVEGTLVHHPKLPTPDGDAEAVWTVVDTLVTEALAEAGGRVR